MPLLTVVQEYIDAAMKYALLEQLEDGTIAASVPGCFGVVAFGVDREECIASLSERLEDWVRLSLTEGQPLPVIDEIDLNSDAAPLQNADHTGRAISAPDNFFENEQAFEAALSAWDENR
jgi:predicted RNase H-like HicB family nuclease